MAVPSTARHTGTTVPHKAPSSSGAIGERDTLGIQPRNRETLMGTRRLMFAVLQNGIDTYLRGNGHERSEAEDWVRSRRRESPFSFTVLCEEFSLDPSAVRVVLAQLRDASTETGMIRARPYARQMGQILAPSRPSVHTRRARRRQRCTRR